MAAKWEEKKFRAFSWEFEDAVIDHELHDAQKREAPVRKRRPDFEDDDYADHAAWHEGRADDDDDDGNRIDTRPYTAEVRCWAVMETSQGRVDRALLRFQRAPVHGYLQLPPKLPLAKGGEVEWNETHVKAIVEWANTRLRELSYRYVLRVTGAELVTRDLLHFYAPESFDQKFVLLFFNTQEAARKLHGCIHGRPNRDEGEYRVDAKKEKIHVLSSWAPFEAHLHETDVDPTVFLSASRGLNLADVFSVKVKEVRDDETEREPRTILDPVNGRRTREYLASWRTARPDEETKIPFEPRQVTYDLEVFMSGASDFPSGKNPGDYIFMCSMITQEGDLENTRRCRLFLTVSTTDVGKRFLENGMLDREKTRTRALRKVEGSGIEYEMLYFDNELAMLRAFYRAINEYDPDMIIGYNILEFDSPYLHDRNEIYRIGDQSNIGRLRPRVKASHVVTRSRKNEKGVMTEYHRWVVPGRLAFDQLPFIQKEHKMRSYSLNSVANEVLNESKIDVTPQEMFSTFAAQRSSLRAITTPAGREQFEMTRAKFDKIADYCIIDSVLVQRLQDKLRINTTLCEFSNIMGVPISALYPGGQQVRVFAQIVRMCIPKEGKSGDANRAQHPGFVIDRHTWNILQVAGATVQDPITGVTDGVMCLDFASLYPSIMRAFNICYSTFIPRELWPKFPKSDCHIFQFTQLEAVNPDEDADSMIVEEGAEDEEDDDDPEYEDPNEFKLAKIKATEVRKSKTAQTEFRSKEYEVRFVKQHVRLGVIPRILEHLVGERGAVKKKMKNPNLTPFEYDQLDKRQLALKVTANATYGFLGAQKSGMLPFPAGFSCVTARGRQLIATVNEILKNEYGATIVYGDTDSTMFSIPGIQGAACLKKGYEVQDAINARFPKPIQMEFEKAMRILIFRKKSYAYYFIEDEEKTGSPFRRNRNGDGYVIKTMGLKPARRDNCPLQIAVFKDSVGQLLERIEPIEMIENTILQLRAMYLDELGIDKYAINKGVGVYEENNPTQMNVLSKTMQNKGMPIKPGDRVDFVIVQQNDPNDAETQDPKISSRARTVEWILTLPEDKRPKIDKHWYTFNALKVMNDSMKMACNYWVDTPESLEERARRRRAIDETIAVFAISKHGASSRILFADAPMNFISNVVYTAYASGARDIAEVIDELLDRIRALFASCTPFTWNLDRACCASLEEMSIEREAHRAQREFERKERERAKRAAEKQAKIEARAAAAALAAANAVADKVEVPRPSRGAGKSPAKSTPTQDAPTPPIGHEKSEPGTTAATTRAATARAPKRKQPPAPIPPTQLTIRVEAMDLKLRQLAAQKGECGNNDRAKTVAAPSKGVAAPHEVTRQCSGRNGATCRNLAITNRHKYCAVCR